MTGPSKPTPSERTARRKNDMKTQEQVAERSAKRFWVSLVVVLLGLQLVIGFVAIRLATGDPSAAVIPDYHNAALNWDDSRRASQAADRLGWSVEISASDIADASGMRATQVTVIDEAGQPVAGLEVTGRAYHHARAGQVETFRLDSIGQGRYMALAPLTRPGLWQIEVMFQNEDQPMKKSSAIELPATSI